MLKLNGHQRYLPPPPLTHYSQQNLSVLGTSRDDLHSNYTTNYTKYTSERHLDDMHDWAIYRTNVNSKYAGGAMQRMQPLPFGEFYLDPSTVDSLHASAKYQQASAFAAESDPHMYIEFGLPRLATKSATSSKVYSSVNLPIEKTAHPWQKPQRKLAHSSGDVSEERASGDAKRPYQRSRSYDAILEEPSREDTAHLISARERKERREEMRQFSRSQPQGVENYAYSADDVHDQRNIDQWESTWERISASVAKKRPLSHYQDDVASAVNANLKVAADSYYKPTSSNLAYDTHPANYRRPAEERYTFEEHKSRGFLENSWQGLGSIDALRAVPYPHLQLRNLTHEVKSKQQGGRIPKQRTSRRILDNLSFEVHGGEIMAIMGHSGSGKTCLLEILGNRMRNGKTVGSVVLNGNLGTTSDLYKKVAHVRKETHLVPYLTVAQTLKFFLMFKKPEHMGWKSKSAMLRQASKRRSTGNARQA
ncbi:PREDICTED: uncharacterized protein LOC106806330 [Priapulus caudatus]|uniref:Uncharacterized protein LOC106806330 n=1 Tax=Priapulus caudatus TaxID=37621 RepID=A0ABM1DUV2_PRICU|nr:PREDICTED: uncharacterized protein LOC106806330 [Priapulus caudatus]